MHARCVCISLFMLCIFIYTSTYTIYMLRILIMAIGRNLESHISVMSPLVCQIEGWGCYTLLPICFLPFGNVMRSHVSFFLKDSISSFMAFFQSSPSVTGASLVGQYPITLVHIVGFKIIKNRTNILQVLGG